MGNNLCVTPRKKKNKKTTDNPPSPITTIVQNYVYRPKHSSNNTTQLYTCHICCEQRHIQDRFYPKGCSHYCCTKCTLTYIVSKLQTNVMNPTCPELGCDGDLDYYWCNQFVFVPSEVLVWWEKALCESWIPEEHRFYCPFNDCSVLMCSEGSTCQGGLNIGASTCPHCKRRICVQCRAPWHVEFTCDRFQKMKNNSDDLMLDLAKRKKWRRCPNCKHYVEKEQGCDDMLCRCSRRFCYNCGKSLHRLRETHKCPFH